MPNRLAQETSPYLKQHMNNPVDWYPWSEEALNRARSENRPILLSIGYSACHWCHVMEHESFENAETARLMNTNYINIKVDREERPDLDQIYQNVAQVFTQGGGWPLTVFLTPELKPFFGGTYFPPEDKYGRPGFPRVLQALSDAYKNQNEGVQENAEKIMAAIASLETVSSSGSASPTQDALREAAEKVLGQVDWHHGGIGSAPKFPNTMIFTFLWRMGTVANVPKAREAVILTLNKMAQGGIYDQLGGGFSRYSVDERWAVPHFEKMLYDNALLLKLYSEVVLTDELGKSQLLTPETRELYSEVLTQSVEYLFREMTSPDGAFYAAQDADSEGEEGKFFAWDPEELGKILGEDEAKVFAIRYGVQPGGNFEHGKTVLYQAASFEEVAERAQLPQARVKELLSSARKKVFKARKRRVHPGLDDKVLTSWNGLMISALAWTSSALEKLGQSGKAAETLRAAERAFVMLKKSVVKDGDRLFSTYQGNSAKWNGYLDDYAFMAQAALDLAKFTRDPSSVSQYLDASEEWIKAVLEHFSDPEGKGYFFTSDDHEKLIQRPKTLLDQAIPSGTAVVLECLMILAEMDRKGSAAQFTYEVEKQMFALFPDVAKSPFGFGEMLCASMLYIQNPVVVSGMDSGEWIPPYPGLFRKAPGPGQKPTEILICHERSCGLPHKSVQAARAEILSKIRKSW